MDIAKSIYHWCDVKNRYEQIKGQVRGVLSKGPVSHGLAASLWSAPDLLQPQRADVGHSLEEFEPFRGCCCV